MSSQPTLRMYVESRQGAAEGVVHLVLVPTEPGTNLPSWKAGAHIDLRSDDGITRQYSLCGRPSDDHFEVAVLNVPDGRGGSRWVHESLLEGAEVDVAGPRNHFELADAPAYLFIAGGIGITPILPMIREVASRDVDWRLVYGGRTRHSMAFAEQLVEEFGEHVDLVPAEERGLIDLAGVLDEQQPGRRVYCCGPEPLLDAVEKVMVDRDSETLHVERFSPRDDVDTSGDAFDVEIAASGATVHVEEGQSIIDALADAGITVDFSCREGTCGTCETGVLGGIPDHRDDVLDDAEKAQNDVMMICVGRCVVGPLLLDL
ncbi:PDR/VanB family oxidoreductase [Aeromicrobium ginsengisoli]|uniref:Oxidoreductase n=1 Tax=Aeromicrobium ginsengisoli TaxID=363867 RepID=A0A5M4F8V5_9ACTN|nr:PDR/VanB family oxidoreductase [Aeromicrobium ginsengisoli]KAA1394224.1 oxidoreductase [Aeromicrobium ginsengisoli]